MAITKELYRTIVKVVEDKVKDIRVTREEFAGLRQVVADLAQAQRRTEEKIGELAQAQKELAQAQIRTEGELRYLAREVGQLSKTIGFGLEDIAYVVLPSYLQRHFGIEVKDFKRKFFEVDGKIMEINLYAKAKKDGQPITILGEVKSRIYRREVERFKKAVIKRLPALKGEVVKVMFGYWIHPYATQLAQKEGIVTVASYER
ncbi:MAG TPA: hypothetical protein EYP21_05280 [Syntrophaceae bacterium]|nr:hypothetical protein [Syntrophaceae bacterium]